MLRDVIAELMTSSFLCNLRRSHNSGWQPGFRSTLPAAADAYYEVPTQGYFTRQQVGRPSTWVWSHSTYDVIYREYMTSSPKIEVALSQSKGDRDNLRLRMRERIQSLRIRSSAHAHYVLTRAYLNRIKDFSIQFEKDNARVRTLDLWV